ncbi:MAG TPA: folate-binding protein [Terriglobales bacterium]|nr:folate-binding protein [Terriglobales bacterium]
MTTLTTPLNEHLLAAGARRGEYRGVETARSFGNPTHEFGILLRGCGLFDLGWRSKISITGKDRIRWMNGMATNNIRDLPVDQGNYNFLLNAQGRIQGDLYVYNFGDHLLVDTEAWQTPTILKLFKHYIIMDAVEVTDISEKLTALGLQGPQSREVLHRLGLNVPDDLRPQHVLKLTWQNVGVSLIRMAGHLADGYEIWLSPSDASRLWDALSAAGATPVGTDALEIFRVTAGIPRFGQDIRDRDLPQETGQMQALNFSKGCYLGQEIVERIRSRGNVHRQLTGLLIEGEPPAPGTKLVVNGKDVGEITTALKVPAAGAEKTLALGYIRKEAVRPDIIVQVNGSQAKLFNPPFREALLTG